MENTPLLAFMHIPKTAGTSFVACLEKFYDPARTFKFYQGELNRGVEDPDLVDWLRWKSDDLDCILGHFSFGIHSLLPIAEFGMSPSFAIRSHGSYPGVDTSSEILVIPAMLHCWTSVSHVSSVPATSQPRKIISSASSLDIRSRKPSP